MPSDQTVLYTLLGVALILLALIFYNNFRARQEQERGGAPMPHARSDEEEGDGGEELLLKFARHEGSVVGETVALDGEHLILKQAGVFKSVLVAQASIDGDEVVIEGPVDWKDAIAKGTAWHHAHTTGHDPLVTERLTTSEDVRKPALEAMKGEEE